MYNNLLNYCEDEDVKDILFRLQAASYNRHLPAFRNAVLNYSNNQNNNGITQENIIEKLGEYQGLLDDIMSGNIDESSISKIFSKLNLSMVSGAVVGGAIIALLSNYVSKKENEEE